MASTTRPALASHTTTSTERCQGKVRRPSPLQDSWKIILILLTWLFVFDVGGAAIHASQAELEDILRLAKADVIHLSELCMSECHDWNNIRHYECKTCPKGSTCMCNTDMPIPVAKPGYCHPKHRRSCFVKCPGGVKQCPPVHVGDKRILGSTGRCPSEVEKTITKDSCP